MQDEKEDVQDIKERLVRIEVLLEQMVKTSGLEKQFVNEQIKVANKRIADLEETQKWTWRTIVGALIIGAIGLLYKLK